MRCVEVRARQDYETTMNQLVDLLVPPGEMDEAKAHANSLPSIQLSRRSLCDLELIATGAFSPLRTFMGSSDYQGVLENMRLSDGSLFPIPITLPISPGEGIEEGAEIALRDANNNLLAFMRIEEVYSWDREKECELVLGTDDERHPLVAEMHNWGPLLISGKLTVLQLPSYRDFTDFRNTPSETRKRLAALGEEALPVIAFKTRTPVHRGHEEILKYALEKTGGTILFHPIVGVTKPGDLDTFTLVRSCQALAKKISSLGRMMISLCPLAMRFAGPREALLHAITWKNYGADTVIIGRSHACPGTDSRGKLFYDPTAARGLVDEFADEIGIELLEIEELRYSPDEGAYLPVTEKASTDSPAKTIPISFSMIRREYLDKGKELPGHLVSPESELIIREFYPPRHEQGVCVWFTGLSGSGKSTIAEILNSLLREYGRRTSLLDGDVVRTHLSKGLGFSKEDRDTNIRRIGWVAAEIVRHQGTSICAAISPYRAVRNEARTMCGNDRFVEVFVDTPLEVCEERDVKGLYAKARRGEIKGFTGIDDPYEVPERAEIVLDTVEHSPLENARLIISYLKEQGFVR